MDMLRTEFDISLPDPGALERRLAGLPGPAASTGSEQRLPRS